jgi:threonine dehydratase
LLNLIGQLSEAQRQHGVVAFSSGNHAQVVAALMAGKVPEVQGKKVGVILSGGNVDSALLVKILEATI